MPKNQLNKVLTVGLLLCAASCSKVPGQYVQPEEMARLMADIHTAEAVIESNRSEYDTDSSRQAFKQSVYAAHGVSAAQVDSSLAWYGRNIGAYMDVCDRTIEILEQRIAETGNRVAAEAAMSMSGDSVDVWTNPRMLIFSPRSASRTVTFAYPADENWEKGDFYTFRAKFVNNTDGNLWSMGAVYPDGSVETVRGEPYRGDGWREIVLRTDSTQVPERIFGFFEATSDTRKDIFLDSLELVRKRLDANRYYERSRQRRVGRYTTAQ